jgi:hypothetical protein
MHKKFIHSIKRTLMQIIVNAFLKLLISHAKSLMSAEGGYISLACIGGTFMKHRQVSRYFEKKNRIIAGIKIMNFRILSKQCFVGNHKQSQ